MPAVLCQFQAVNNQCCDWTNPCGSYYDYNMSCSNNDQETLKKVCGGLLFTRPGNYTWGHTVRLQVQKEHAGLGFCFYWGQGWGGKGFMD